MTRWPGQRDEPSRNWWAAPAILPADDPRVSGMAAVWFLHLPDPPSPFADYTLQVIDLDQPPRPGSGPVHKQYPQARWELMMVTLNPDHSPTPETSTWYIMRPVNYIRQFDGVDRAGAARIAEGLVTACLRLEVTAETNIPVDPGDAQGMRYMYVQELLDRWDAVFNQLLVRERGGASPFSVN